MLTLLSTQTDTTVMLNNALEGFFAKKLEESHQISPYYHDLWQQIARLLSLGGKRLRPRLAVLSYRAFGGQDVEAIIPAAAAQELLHLGMLIHDDIIDRDYIRYGVDNVAGGYIKLYGELVSDDDERLHYSHSAALLAGDLLLSESYLLIAESKVPAETAIAVQRLLGKAIFEVIGGELLDTESAFRGLGAVPAEMVALYKTASYTFALPLLAGAKLACLPDESLQYVHDFAKNLGIAFQLRDDIIGIFGDEKATGKTIIGDIREGKRTFMIEQFYNLATDDQKETFNQYFGSHTVTDGEAEIVRDLLKTSGAFARTEDVIAEYELNARTALAKLPVRQDCTEEFEQLITIATKRSA